MNYEYFYKNNLQYLEKLNSNTKELVEIENIDNFELVVDENGSLENVLLDGEKLYPTMPEELSLLQVDTFLSNPRVSSEIPFMHYSHENGGIHDKYALELILNSPLKNEKGEFYFTKYNVRQKQIPFMVMSGFGCGFQVGQLLNLVDIHNLVIIDSDYKFFKLSLNLFDWIPIFEYFSKEGRQLRIIVNDDCIELGRHILVSIAQINPSYSGLFYIFEHLQNEFFSKAIEHAIEKINLVTKGWGFYDDEIISYRNTFLNVISKHKVLTTNSYEDIETEEIPLFIVGSGPSLDDDINFIKNNKSKAIIFSSGSAINALYKHDIVPDFHFEIERTDVTYRTLVESDLDLDYLKKINFIGLNVLEPRVFSLFKDSFIYFRVNDAGQSVLFNHIPQIMISNPSVTNAVMSLSLLFKFKNIYLFGIDNGFIDPKKHHSKDSIYYEDGSEFYEEEMGESRFKMIKGNFDEDVYTTSIYFWVLEMLESAITAKHDSTTIFNCSNGAYIKGTIPLKSENIILESSYSDDSKVNAVSKHFSVLMSDEVINFELAKQMPSILIDDIKALVDVIDKHMKNINQNNIVLFLQMFHDYIKSSKQFTRSMISGSIKIYSAFIYTHLMSSNNKDKNDFFIAESLKTIKRFLMFVRSDISKLEQLIANAMKE